MNKNNITKSEIQRLSFIKYLYNVAVEQSYKPDPFDSAAVLTFHDSVELFLILACEHLDIVLKDHALFKEYIDKLKPLNLTQITAIKRLNKSRADLKHHGLLPHKQEIEGFRESVKNFFSYNTPLFFNIDFDNITMIELVVYEEIRESLKKAKECKQKGDIEKSLIEIAFAFHKLMEYYKEAKRSLSNSPFDYGCVISYENVYPGMINKEIEILGLGLDYRKYL